MSAANTDHVLAASKALSQRLRQKLHSERLLIAPVCGAFAERSFARNKIAPYTNGSA